MKKPRKDRSEHALTEAQEAQLAEWLLSGMGYIQASELIQKEWGIRMGKNAIMRFYHEICTPAVLARRARAAQMSRALEDDMRRRPGSFDKATIELVAQKAFEISADPNAKPDDVRNLVSLILKIRDQELAEKKLALDTERLQLEIKKYQDAIAAAQREIASVKSSGGITPETLQKIEQALKLI